MPLLFATTMVPLESVFGWIFAVIGFGLSLLMLLCSGGEQPDKDAMHILLWFYCVGQLLLILGVALVTAYWGLSGTGGA